MQQNQQQPKVTKKVIIINQKSDVVNENINLLNRNDAKQGGEQKPQQNVQNQFEQLEVGPSVHSQLREMNSLYERNQSKLKELQICVQALKKRTEQLEKSLGEMESGRKKKKKRRTAAEIEKKFKCPYQNCERTYGSDVSLNLHIKFKHGGGNKSERERILVCLNQRGQRQLQSGELSEKDVSLNLP